MAKFQGFSCLVSPEARVHLETFLSEAFFESKIGGRQDHLMAFDLALMKEEAP